MKSSPDLDASQIEANVNGVAFMNICMAMSQLALIMSGWKNRQKLVDLMNGWPHAERNNAVPENTNYYCSVAIAIAYIVSAGVAGILVGSSALPHPDRALEATYRSLLFSYFFFSECLQDAVVNLLFYELSNDLRQVSSTKLL